MSDEPFDGSEFLAWEAASRDTIDVKRIYVDLTGDLATAMLLSQIIYWHLPGDEGSKLRVKRNGKQWLAKGRADWWDECRITTKQFDRSIAILRTLNLVETKLFRFAGSPTVHIHLNLPALMEGVKSILTKGQKPVLYRKGKNQITERGRTITESTTEITPIDEEEVEMDGWEKLFIYILHGLPKWAKDEGDLKWLQEFRVEFPDVTVRHVIECRDYHDGRPGRLDRGVWKNRLRQWILHDRRFDERTEEAVAPGSLSASIGKPIY